MDPVKTQIKMEVAHCSTLNKQGFIKVNKTLTAISGASNPDELIKILEPDNERRNSSNSSKSINSNNIDFTSTLSILYFTGHPRIWMQKHV